MILTNDEETETMETITLHDVTGFARKGGTDEHGNAWLQFEVEDDAEICTVCHEEIVSGGWVCLDGGEVVCDEHIVLDESGFDKREARS